LEKNALAIKRRIVEGTATHKGRQSTYEHPHSFDKSQVVSPHFGGRRNTCCEARTRPPCVPGAKKCPNMSENVRF